jgi:hypothetical protein
MALKMYTTSSSTIGHHYDHSIGHSKDTLVLEIEFLLLMSLLI